MNPRTASFATYVAMVASDPRVQAASTLGEYRRAILDCAGEDLLLLGEPVLKALGRKVAADFAGNAIDRAFNAIFAKAKAGR